jgi:hypothetical protein
MKASLPPKRPAKSADGGFRGGDDGGGDDGGGDVMRRVDKIAPSLPGGSGGASPQHPEPGAFVGAASSGDGRSKRIGRGGISLDTGPIAGPSSRALPRALESLSSARAPAAASVEVLPARPEPESNNPALLLSQPSQPLETLARLDLMRLIRENGFVCPPGARRDVALMIQFLRDSGSVT